MSHTAVRTFADSLADLPATHERVAADKFTERAAVAVEAPAVGVPFPFDGVSLDDLPVTVSPSPAELEAARTGVTPAALAVADYGSVVVESDAAGAEPASLYPERHVVVVAESDVVDTMGEAMATLDKQFREGATGMVVATGPSATADMGDLVLGAHGPREVHVISLTDR